MIRVLYEYFEYMLFRVLGFEAQNRFIGQQFKAEHFQAIKVNCDWGPSSPLRPSILIGVVALLVRHEHSRLLALRISGSVSVERS